MTVLYTTKRKPYSVKTHARISDIPGEFHVMKVLKRNTNLFISFWGRDSVNLNM